MLARVRLLRHPLPISLLILRKKPTVLQSNYIPEKVLSCVDNRDESKPCFTNKPDYVSYRTWSLQLTADQMN